MKNLFVVMSAVFLMAIGMIGTASAIPESFVSTTQLDRWLWGQGSTPWEMSMPATFEMPPAQVISAGLTIYSNYVNDRNDIVSVATKLEGTWTPLPGALTPDKYSGELSQAWWLQWTFNMDSNPLNPLEASVFNVTSYITEPWALGAPLKVSLAYNEPTYKDFLGNVKKSPLFLDYAQLNLVWDKGSAQNTAAPVPEPGTMVLLGFGMLGLVIYGKRRMNRDV